MCFRKKLFMSYTPFDYPSTTAVAKDGRIAPCSPTGKTLDPATTDFKHTDGTETSEREMEEGSPE
jgi:hypothetical protein